MLILIVLQATPLPPTTAYDLRQASAGADRLSATQRCDRSTGDEIIVCGTARDHRLPLAIERDPFEATGPVGGEAPRASAEPMMAGGCGIFAGQRRCGNAERAAHGYGGGRDPVTVLTRLGTLLVDPDAEVAPPSRLPTPAKR